jgi:hypothetical protein
MATPNLFHLTSYHLDITYTTTGFDGKPHLSYHDAVRTLQFSGDQIEAAETKAGLIVSVVIVMTVDSGSTTFSMLVPRMNIDAGSPAPVRTEGITTIHRFSIVPALNRGQLDSYTVTPLRGTAEVVAF